MGKFPIHLKYDSSSLGNRSTSSEILARDAYLSTEMDRHLLFAWLRFCAKRYRPRHGSSEAQLG